MGLVTLEETDLFEVVDGAERWQDGLGLLLAVELDLGLDVVLEDLGSGGPRYLTGPGGKAPSFQGQGGKRGRIGLCTLEVWLSRYLS